MVNYNAILYQEEQLELQTQARSDYFISRTEKRQKAFSVPFYEQNNLDPQSLSKWTIVYNSRGMVNSHNL